MEFSLSVSSETDMPHMREYAQEPPLMFSAAPPLLWAVHSPITSSMPPFTTSMPSQTTRPFTTNMLPSTVRASPSGMVRELS